MTNTPQCSRHGCAMPALLDDEQGRCAEHKRHDDERDARIVAQARGTDMHAPLWHEALNVRDWLSVWDDE